MTDQNPRKGKDNSTDGEKRGQSDENRRGNQPPSMRMNRGMFGWLLLIGLAVLLYVVLSNAQNQAKEVESWGAFVAYVQSDDIEQITIEDSRIVGTLREDVADAPPSGKIMFAVSPNTKRVYTEQLLAMAPDLVNENPSSDVLMHLLFSVLPWVLVLLVIWFFLFRSLRSAAGGGGFLGNFGRSKHKVVSKEMTNITLGDVAGVEEAKDEVQEIIEFLKNPKKFQRLGGRIPRGVLLVGEPGCGKTLLAKAVAGEAEVPFFSISGSDFVEMFVGVGASRVRDLFKQAKDSSPCIIFLDEIDAVGRRRGSGFSSGGHDEREQTLNAILVEMDGFETNDQVIVIAATNRSDVLDPALTRPGRFDRQINVPLPDIKGRLEILKVHADKVKMGPNVDLQKLARGTPMFSGADLAAIINESAIMATISDKDYVEQDDLEEARDKVKWGRSTKSRVISEGEKKTIAYHEAGHAILAHVIEEADPLHKVSIIPRGQALGVTFQLPEQDRFLMTGRQAHGTMKVLFGGRIAEEMFIGDVSSGAMDDIRRASQLARTMVKEWGMSTKLGPIRLALDQGGNPWERSDQPYSDETAEAIDDEVRNIIEQNYNKARQLIETHREAMENLAEALLKYETVTADEVDRIMRGEKLDRPTVSDLLDAEAAKPAPKPKNLPKPDDRSDDAPEAGPMPSPA